MQWQEFKQISLVCDMNIGIGFLASKVFNNAPKSLHIISTCCFFSLFSFLLDPLALIWANNPFHLLVHIWVISFRCCFCLLHFIFSRLSVINKLPIPFFYSTLFGRSTSSINAFFCHFFYSPWLSMALLQIVPNFSMSNFVSKLCICDS